MKNSRKGVFVVLSIILIAACLRGPITGVGPLITTLQEHLGLSGFASGMLTTLPMLTFAAVSFITAPLSRKIGIGRLMLISLIVLFAGLLIRSFCGTAGLFIGTVILAAGIGINNVLLPVVVKSRFPEHIGTLTSVYTTLMAGFASLSSGISIPLANAFASAFGAAWGWKLAICIWIILVVFAFIFWLPNTNERFDGGLSENAGGQIKRRSVAASAISWFITLFMGFQSMCFYFTVSWFATILQFYGYSRVNSGLFNMIMMLCGLPASFIMPIIASRTKHQSVWGAVIGALYAVGMVSLLFAGNPAGLVITILSNGVGSGASIAFCMVLFALHTKDAADANSLSSMAQGVGYIFAAVSPILMGSIFDMTGAWTVPLIIMTVIGIACAVCGWLSGLDKMVDTTFRSSQSSS